MRVVAYHMLVKLLNVNFILCWPDNPPLTKLSTNAIVVESYFEHDIVILVVNDPQSNVLLNMTSDGNFINTLSPEYRLI